MIIGNCGTLTANLLLLPEAVLDDGRLDVVVLRPKTVFGWGHIGTRITAHGVLRRFRLGRKLVELSPDLKALHYRQGRQIEVRFSVPHVIELDGVSSGPVIGARFTAHRGELRVCV